MPTREWHPSSPYHHYSCPPAHAIIQRHEEHSPEENQSGYTAHFEFEHTIAKHEVNEIDGRKPAAQDILKPVQDQASRLVNPPLQFLEGLELRSATMKEWQYNEEAPFNENVLDPAPEQLSMRDAREAPVADEQGHIVKEEHNPLDIDNFYDLPTKAHNDNEKEWVVYPSQKTREEGGEGGSPEPEY